MSNARLYAKIMRHLEETTGTGSWDFRTLNLTHPQLATCIGQLVIAVTGNVDLRNHCAPRRLWGYESEVTA